MLWFLLHQVLKVFPFGDDQTKNLTTFLVGTVIYTLFYSYIGSLDFQSNQFFKVFFNFFFYIVLADAFAMAVVYKNYYKHTILTEVKETLGSPTEKNNNDKSNLSDSASFSDEETS